jgi:hypothetical protein
MEKKIVELFYVIMLFSSLTLQGMEGQQERQNRSGFDLLLINKGQYHRVKLKLNKTIRFFSTPNVQCEDHDGQKIFINNAYEPSDSGIDRVILQPEEACLLKDIELEDIITWRGSTWFRGFTNVPVDVKDAIAKKVHVIRFIDGKIMDQSNQFYTEIRALIDQPAEDPGEPDVTNLNQHITKRKREDNSNQRPLKRRNITLSQDTNLKEIDINDQFESFTYEQNKQGGVKALYTYEPAERAESARPILLVVVHGTWAHGSAAFYDSQDPEFQNILKFAQEIAEENQTKIEILSFGWTGKNNYACRVTAGQNLARILMNFYDRNDNNHTIITLAHSHGCNVVNTASRLIQGLTINRMIHLATPIRDENEDFFKPDNFDNLMQFYSTSDLVGAAGALSTYNIFSSQGSIRKYAQQENRAIYNIRTQIDGADTGHSALTAIIPYLKRIVTMISEHYLYHTDLDINVNTQDKRSEPVMISIRHLLSVEDLFTLPGMPELTEENAQPIITLLRNVKKESDFNAAQEQYYKLLYADDIHSKKYLVQRFLEGAYAEITSNLL